MIFRIAAWASLCAAALEGQPSLGQQGKASPLRAVDWANFTYPFVRQAALPREMRWLPFDPVGPKVTLERGVRRFENSDCVKSGVCPILTYEFTEYGKVSGLKAEVAVVVTTFSANPEFGWQYVYVFTLEGSEPKLLGWLEAGYKFSQGLKGLALESGSLVLDLYDPSRQVGQSCSLGFTRVRYRWKKNAFERYGEAVPGYVPFEDCRAVAAPVLKKRRPH